MEQFDRAFKGIWIPAEIWNHKELDAQMRILLAEIDSLDKGEGCSASNKYFADFIGCKEDKISKMITKLIDLKMVTLAHFNGRVRCLKSNIKVVISREEVTEL